MITFEEFCIISGLLFMLIGVVMLITITMIKTYKEDKPLKKSIKNVEKETKKRIEKMNKKYKKKAGKK